ncbi:MAG: V4R domain-containing protein [Thermofilum sp.]
MELEDLSNVIRQYREQALREERGEAELSPRVESFTLTDLLAAERPTFQSLNPEDAVYVMTFRLLRWSQPPELGEKALAIVLYSAGREIGEKAVERGLVSSIEELANFTLNQRIGILDVLEAGEKHARILVYESISSSGIPNIGRAVCHFERGLIAGSLHRLTGRRVTVRENHCWGLGYTHDSFEVTIE